MSVLLISITSVALAEIGDKTQLLSFLLASRYRKPIPIIAAIFFATILNHALAAWFGVMVADYLSPEVLKWTLVVSFVAFFIAEIGDKTQVATTVLGAQYHDALVWVILGTTIGMLLANVPVVLAGQFSAEKLPLNMIRKVTAVLFLLLAIGAALGL